MQLSSTFGGSATLHSLVCSQHVSTTRHISLNLIGFKGSNSDFYGMLSFDGFWRILGDFKINLPYTD
jgi:hypothetical protein